MVRGDGPRVWDGYFCQGDEFKCLDGAHEECDGKSLVLGQGYVVKIMPGGMQAVSRGVLVRCQGCLLSYVIASQCDEFNPIEET